MDGGMVDDREGREMLNCCVSNRRKERWKRLREGMMVATGNAREGMDGWMVGREG